MNTRIARIDQKIQRGRGKASRVLGQTYDVYRLTAKSNGSVIGPKPLYHKFPVSLRRTTKKDEIENTIFDLLCYVGTCDNRHLELGDVFVENGYESAGSVGTVYVLAQARPLRHSLFMRCEQGAAVLHPHPEGGGADAQPVSGAVAVRAYGGVSVADRQPLYLAGGLYAFDTTGMQAPASVPIGLQPLRNIRDGHRPKIPNTLARTFFVAYIPPTPGVIIAEKDLLKMTNQDVYEVEEVYTSEPAGLVGTVAIVEKTAT